ncbi:putative fungal trna ligase adenylyltransferase [Erysiphe necator]|uniref:tRNA ligase n=1 Tax=Uncinula necator TaxID=52586 RepID=A0A0B1PIR9_UNCNE|nr:putative fungal trna ligase adenylyltransferase [Erysiphe necator]
METFISKVPYISQNVSEVQNLVRKLEEGEKNRIKHEKKSICCKKTSFYVQGATGTHVIDSWRLRDWDYKLPDLPTYARGLFIGKNGNDEDEIVIRGYNKFFNVGEVSTTKWPNIVAATKGPYEISLKENGCILFISGLWDGTLLVCSKHSTGPRKDEISHAMAGERWIEKQLTAIGKTRVQLARELRSRNATAVAELCDDEFEEHILPYTKENAGLYLHGININIPSFVTYPSYQVEEFAEKWGFRTTSYLVHDDVQITKKFLEDVAETGSFNNRDIEGFVIRCKARHEGSGPYHDWFFKYKFEEPYLMYRQWRECTKALINDKSIPLKKNVEITEEYLRFAKQKLAENPELKVAYAHNHGIIKLRNEFLKEKNLKSSDIVRQEYVKNIKAEKENGTKNVILLPVGTIGCGKTTIGISLQHIFGWGLVQNDNISGRNRPTRFTNEVLSILHDKSVVFADRNNSLRRERAQFIGDIYTSYPQVRIVALNFIHRRELLDQIRQVTQQRVYSRGDNHQTIQAATDRIKAVSIMEGFIKRFEHLDPFTKPDNGFDVVIDLDPLIESRQNLEIVISKLHQYFPSVINSIPSSEVLDKAIYYALNEYRPGPKHAIGNQDSQKQQKAKSINYFCIKLEESQIRQIVANAFGASSPDTSYFWKQLSETNRVQQEFHITLIHRSSSHDHNLLWKKYSDIYAKRSGGTDKNSQGIGQCRALLEMIVWDSRVMAIVVRLIDKGWECVNNVAHITIGTRDHSIKPKESNDLLQRWTADSDPTIRSLAIENHPVVNGTVTVVFSP